MLSFIYLLPDIPVYACWQALELVIPQFLLRLPVLAHRHAM